MTIPTREEHLLKTLKWLESRVHTCPICIRRENELREELALIKAAKSMDGLGAEKKCPFSGVFFRLPCLGISPFRQAQSPRPSPASD